MTKTILLVRHGAVADDGARRFIGRTDVPMSEAGEAQVRALALTLSAYPLDAVYCSNLERSRRTADLLAIGRDVSVRALPALAEIDMGAWEGRLRGEMVATHPDEYAARGRDIVHFRPPGGESFADLAARVLPAWRSLLACDDHTVAVAGHAGVNRVILCDVLGMPLADLFRVAQEPGCVTLIEFDCHGQGSVVAPTRGD